MPRFLHHCIGPCVLAALSLAAAPRAKEPPATATAPASMPSQFEQQLDDIDTRAGKWEDLSADFVQEKNSPLLRKPLVSRGTVKARGGVSLWQTSEPERTQMVVDPRLLRLYYPDQKVIEEYAIEARLGMMAASPLPRLRAIRQNFKLLPDDGANLLPDAGERDARHLRAVRMMPATDEIAKFVERVRVLLDEDRALVLVFELVDPDGERTVIRFSNIKTNTGLSDESLKLKAAADVKVVRPLDKLVPDQP